MTNKPLPDIKVQVTFLTHQEGGRRGPVFSGYRPQFFYNGHDWDAVYTFPEREEVPLGVTTTAYLTFLSPEMHIGRVYVGMRFEAREGQRVVGRGIITKIIDLSASAQRADVERPKRYHSLYWPDDRADDYAHWGGATYYFECRASGYPEQQLQIYDNGQILWYDTDHHTDRYGTLRTVPVGLFDPDIKEISAAEFYAVIRNITPNNRLEKPKA